MKKVLTTVWKLIEQKLSTRFVDSTRERERETSESLYSEFDFYEMALKKAFDYERDPLEIWKLRSLLLSILPSILDLKISLISQIFGFKCKCSIHSFISNPEAEVSLAKTQFSLTENQEPVKTLMTTNLSRAFAKLT